MVRLLPFAILLYCCSARADCRNDLGSLAGGYVGVDSNVDPVVCRAVLAAARRLPPAHRQLLAGLTVVRLPDGPGPAPSGLVERLVASIDLASYQPHSHLLVVTDLGAAGRPRWRFGRATAAQVTALLGRLGSHLGSPHAGPVTDPAAGWATLRSRVVDDGIGKPLGDAALFGALIARGSRRLYGEPLTLAVALDHAMARVVALRSAVLAERPSAVLAGFARMTAWTDHAVMPGEPAAPGRPADVVDVVLALLGFANAGSYAAGPGARFATPLAGLSPAHDFCESYRLARTRPDAVPPVKLLAVNALAWSSGLPEADAAGLRLPSSLFEGAAGRARLLAGARALLGHRGDKGAGALPLDALSILAAHRALLSPVAASLPRSAPTSWPPDAPADLRAKLGPDVLQLQLGAVRVRPAAHRVRAGLISALRDYEARPSSITHPPVRDAIRAADQRSSGWQKGLMRASRLAAGLPHYARARNLRAIAGAYARQGDTDRASAVATSITGELVGAREQAKALIEIARGHVQRAEWGPVARLLERAASVLPSVPSVWRDALWAELARTYAQAGNYEQARETLARLQERHGAADLAVLLRAEIAGWLAGEGRAQEAIEAAKRVLALLPRVRASAVRERLGAAVAAAFARVGRLKEALAVWSRPDDFRVRVSGLAAAAAQAARLRDRGAWRRVVAVAKALPAPWERATALAAIARAAGRAAGVDSVTKVLATASKAASRERSLASRSGALEGIGDAWFALGRHGAALAAVRGGSWYFLPRAVLASRVARWLAANGTRAETMKAARAVRGHDAQRRTIRTVEALLLAREAGTKD